MSEHSCIFHYLHDWRLHDTREVKERGPEPGPDMAGMGALTVRVYDTWYCTRCRKLETIERKAAT